MIDWRNLSTDCFLTHINLSLQVLKLIYLKKKKSFAVLCIIVGPHQCRKLVHRGWTQWEESKRLKECRALTTENQRNSLGSHRHYLFFLCSIQRPYVMRSSTPANEIIQIFHKVHPSYPAAWSLEMKSLLRKVMSHTPNSHHNSKLIQPCPCCHAPLYLHDVIYLCGSMRFEICAKRTTAVNHFFRCQYSRTELFFRFKQCAMPYVFL